MPSIVIATEVRILPTVKQIFKVKNMEILFILDHTKLFRVPLWIWTCHFSKMEIRLHSSVTLKSTNGYYSDKEHF